jgi:hypothetical protein
MQSEQGEQLAELVEHAFELEGTEWAAFLAQVCGDDVELRAEAEAVVSMGGRRFRKHVCFYLWQA